MAFGATLRAPHGGVFVVPLIGEPFCLPRRRARTLVTAALQRAAPGSPTASARRQRAAALGKTRVAVTA
ncbi:PTS sugar transporter subunit IIA [Streptomyces californicus]